MLLSIVKCKIAFSLNLAAFPLRAYSTYQVEEIMRYGLSQGTKIPKTNLNICNDTSQKYSENNVCVSFSFPKITGTFYLKQRTSVSTLKNIPASLPQLFWGTNEMIYTTALCRTAKSHTHAGHVLGIIINTI